MQKLNSAKRLDRGVVVWGSRAERRGGKGMSGRAGPGTKDLFQTRIYDQYSGYTKITTHRDHISHDKTTSGTNRSNRWTKRVFIINIRRGEIEGGWELSSEGKRGSGFASFCGSLWDFLAPMKGLRCPSIAIQFGLCNMSSEALGASTCKTLGMTTHQF